VQRLEQNKERESGIGESLLETSDGASTLLETDSVPLHTTMGKLTLLRSKPSGGKRMVRKEEDSCNGDCDCNDTLLSA
jgi:hypothetical protein